jgi:phenylacetate-CoA ligase
MELYWRLPVFVQELIISIYASRLEKINFGPSYREWCSRLHGWQSWSRTETEAWQTQQLQYLVELAATRVPYYLQEWRHVDWKSVQAAADLPLLPRLPKQAIRQNEQAFLVTGVEPKTLCLERTSGSTGTALRIYRPLSMQPIWWAMYEMCRNMAGVGRESPYATMQGRAIVRGNTSKPPYWRYNRRWHQVYLSSYHISRATTPAYVEAMRTYGVQWIEGYGSGFAALAENALAAGISPLPLRAAIVSGDTLLPRMRACIEQFFQCPCFDLYGQSEGVCMAMQCAYGRMHVIPVAGIVEILREDGSACALGEVGEVVATGLLNDAMPLIRYRLGDYAAWAEVHDCPCGNAQPIIANLEGRVDDYLVTADGRKIGRLSTAIKRSPTIHSAQLVQDRPGHAYLLVQPASGYQAVHATAVCADIVERIGAFALDVVEVPEIPKTSQGKTVLVVRLEDRPHTRQVYDKLLKCS